MTPTSQKVCAFRNELPSTKPGVNHDFNSLNLELPAFRTLFIHTFVNPGLL